MFLSMRASSDQSDLVFSGVFSVVWIGEAVVTLQIKLLGGNMWVIVGMRSRTMANLHQILHAISLYHRLYIVPTDHCSTSERPRFAHDCSNPRLYCSGGVVIGRRCQYPRRIGRGQEPGGTERVSSLCLLRRTGLPVFH